MGRKGKLKVNSSPGAGHLPGAGPWPPRRAGTPLSWSVSAFGSILSTFRISANEASIPSGAKAPLILWLTARLKSCPDTSMPLMKVFRRV